MVKVIHSEEWGMDVKMLQGGTRSSFFLKVILVAVPPHPVGSSFSGLVEFSWKFGMSPKHKVTWPTVVFLEGFCSILVTIKAGCAGCEAKSAAHAEASDSGSGLMWIRTMIRGWCWCDCDVTMVRMTACGDGSGVTVTVVVMMMMMMRRRRRRRMRRM